MGTGAKIVALLALALTGCTGGGDPGADGARSSNAPERAASKARGVDLRRAQMQSGTDWADGVLASFCNGGDCTDDPDAEPEDVVKASDSGVLLFIVPQTPLEGSVEIVRQRSGRAVLGEALEPGTTMPVEASLPSGRYVVSLTATWPDREARWLFGLRVPA